MKVEDFHAVFYPGGHGPLWDLHNDNDSIALIEDFIAARKPVASVCHAPAVLLLEQKMAFFSGDYLVLSGLRMEVFLVTWRVKKKNKD